MGRLDGKIAVLTGTSRGLGKALAEAFFTEGATVIGASRHTGVDVSDPAVVREWLGEAARNYDGIDILVNNAGILTPRKALVAVTDEEWRQSIAVNLDAVFYCMREALRWMIPRGSGLIINVSSGVSGRAAPQWGAYAAAKWGVEGLTKLAAEEVKGQGIKVVSINPGRTRTDMRAAAYPDEDPATVKTPEDAARFFVAVAAGEVAFTTGDTLEYREPPA